MEIGAALQYRSRSGGLGKTMGLIFAFFHAGGHVPLFGVVILTGFNLDLSLPLGRGIISDLYFQLLSRSLSSILLYNSLTSQPYLNLLQWRGNLFSFGDQLPVRVSYSLSPTWSPPLLRYDAGLCS